MQATIEIDLPALAPANPVFNNGDIPAVEFCQFHLHGTGFQPTNGSIVCLADVTEIFLNSKRVVNWLDLIDSRTGP